MTSLCVGDYAQRISLQTAERSQTRVPEPQWMCNAESLTTPAVSRVFFFFSTKTRTHFSVGARTASFTAASVHLYHPNLLSPFTIINSVLPTKHLFDHHRP